MNQNKRVRDILVVCSNTNDHDIYNACVDVLISEGHTPLDSRVVVTDIDNAVSLYDYLLGLLFSCNGLIVFDGWKTDDISRKLYSFALGMQIPVWIWGTKNCNTFFNINGGA